MTIVIIFVAMVILSGHVECRVSKDDFMYGNYVDPGYIEDFSTTTNETLDYNIGIPSAETFTKANKTLEFLATFTPGFQRELVYQQVKNCPLTSLCNYRFNSAIVKLSSIEKPCCTKCSCEFPVCMFSRTCCIDMLLRSTNISHETNFDEGNTQCIPLHLTQDNTMSSATDRYYGAFMYASCPPGTVEQLNINCTRKYSYELYQYKDIVPVTNMLSSATFRNAYCAYCNGVENKYLAQAEVVLTCNKPSKHGGSEHDVIKAALEEETCDVMFQSTDYVTFRTCETSIVECNVTGRWLHYNASVEKACKLYRNVIFIEDIYYNNIFCAMCNGMTIEKYKCISFGNNLIDTYSFSGLLKLESGGENAEDENSKNDCSGDQLHDYVFGKCRNILCSPLMNLKQGKCKESFSEIRNVKYTMYLRIRPIENITLFEGYLLADQLINYLYNLPLLDTPCGILFMYHVQESLCNESSETMAFTSLSYFKVRVQIDMTRFHDPYKMFDMFSMLHKSNHSIQYFDYHEKRLSVFNALFELSDDISTLYDNLARLTEAEQYNDEFNHKMGDEFILPLEVLIENHSYTTNNSGLDIFNLRFKNKNIIGVCSVMINLEFNVLHLDPCPKVLISKFQVAWKQTDDGIKLIDTNMIIDNTDFYYNSSDSIVVCVEVYKEYMQKFRDSSFSTMTIVSIVCSTVSLFSLIFTCIVFLVLPKLRRNLPGKNNMSLVPALICAQCLYLISGMGVFEGGTPQCAAVGMLLHFSWLLSLFWMNICTYHMFHVLTKTKVMSRKSGKCRFTLYHLYAVTMSAILVAINVIVQMSANGSYGYGDTTCYISSQKMIVYTFGIPVAVIVLCNLCMYFVVIYKIGMSPSVQKNVKHERNDFIIFIKLSTLTGATWVFGLINYWADVIILSYLFILLNATQGVFIMFAFILNHRVFSMFRQDVLGHDVTFTDTEPKTLKPPGTQNRR